MKIFSDYNKIDTSSTKGRAKIFGAIAHFLRQPDIIHKKLIAAGVTQFTNTDDFGTEVRALIEKFHLGLEEIDNGWEQFFSVRD